MSNWPAAILFDFDGVIVNSEPLHFFAFQEVLAAEKIELTEQAYYEELIGFDDRNAFKHVYARHGRELDPRTFLRVMAQKNRTLMDLIRRRKYAALRGVEEFIRGLWRNYPLAICSGALREEIEAMLEGISLRDCFPVIVAAEDVSAGKPDPEGYLLTARLVGERYRRDIAPKDCLVVEDAPTVVASVKRAGFPVMAVATTYPPEKLREADWIIPRLNIDDALQQIPELNFTR